jgi:hypothetical protein
VFVYKTLALPQTVYTRFYLYWSTTTALQDSPPIGFTDAAGSNYVRLYLKPSGLDWVVFANVARTPYPSGNANVPPGQWLCIETMVRFDSSNGELTAWLNGEQVADVSGVATQPAAVAENTFQIGSTATESYQTGQVDSYIDEVVVSALRIGCN